MISQLLVDTQGSFLRQASSNSQGVESSKYLESSILYDHMYNKLEEKLNIKDISMLSDFDKDKSSERNSIIKVTGYVEIEDYQNLDSLLEKFNKIGESIAHSMMSSSAEIMARKNELAKRLVESSSKNKKEIQEQINNLSNPKFIAKDSKLWQDPILLENLRFIVKTFGSDGYHVVLSPKNNIDIRYKGILNRAWLRDDPMLIRSLYGGESKNAWSMVGVITYFPEENSADKEIVKNIKAGCEENSNTDGDVMILDAYRNMFRATRVFEKMFMKSNDGTEVIVSPLAIYREFQIQVKQP